MEKLQRNERIAALLKVLTDNPNKIYTLGQFTEMFGTAKSTLSEDIDIVQKLLARFQFGTIETISGASGGIRYFPTMGDDDINQTVDELIRDLSKKERIIPGGFLYMLDLIYSPEMVSKIARIFAKAFYNKNVNYVLTMETKGIPLAFMTAKYLNIPLIIVRHNNEATDGASVNINYVSGSSKKIQTMVLPLRALKRNSNIIFVDDFMKGGGTANGIAELAKEFDCHLVGTAVLIETAEPAKKLVDNFFSILTLYGVDDENMVIDIRPSTK